MLKPNLGSQIDTQSHHISRQNVTTGELGEEVVNLRKERKHLQNLYDEATLKITKLQKDVQGLQEEKQRLEETKDEIEASAEYWKDLYFKK